MCGRDISPLKVLKLLHFHPEGLPLAEISRQLGLSSRVVRRALRALEAEGFTAFDPLSHRYLIRYPHPFVDIPQAVDDPLFYQELVDEVFARTHLRAYILSVRPWGLHLEATAGHQGQRLWPFPGNRKPATAHAHASAGGRAILAHLREEAVHAHLHRFPPKAFTPHTPATVPQVLERLAEVRSLGFARARGEIISNRCGLAVPLLTGNGQAFAALGLSLPLGRRCALEAPEDRSACRRCFELAPVLREVVAEVWRSSEA
ncbi:IclR family transcriptional regulator [Thermus sp. PS18]|uniref:IclR family transcriptional regulator n=1 Tax=Thermus sp. PS18 TaxID=2849039 RepID=UPI003A5C7DE6